MDNQEKLAFLDASTQESAPQPLAPAVDVPKLADVLPIQEQPSAIVPPVETPAVQPKPEAKGSDGHAVPLPKYLDAYNEARELKRQLAEYQRKEQEAKAQVPDVFENPAAYNDWVQQSQAKTAETVAQQMTNMRLGMSETLTRSMLGDKIVDEALESLASSDQLTVQRLMATANPMQEVVKWHKQQKLLSEIGDPDKFDDFIRSRYATLSQQPGAIVPQQTPQAPTMPAPSLSRAPASPRATDVPIGPGSSFDSVF